MEQSNDQSATTTTRTEMQVADRHYVNGNPLKAPWPEGLLTIVLGKG